MAEGHSAAEGRKAGRRFEPSQALKALGFPAQLHVCNLGPNLLG